MTPQEFAALFPGRPFAIRYVERGEHGGRKFVWHVMFTSDYFTSDSDRAVYDHGPPRMPDGFGATLDEAFDAVVTGVVRDAERRVSRDLEELRKSETELREVKTRLGAG
jgi:hypothetical protein